MHSSTSSSSTRLPTGGWLRSWCQILLIVILVVGGWELFVRERGIGDTAVSDSVDLWVRERERASQLGSKALILVGASRMQMGLDLQVLKQHTSKVPVQLAISDSPFLPVFEHLANDRSITGTVVVSLTASDMLLSTRETLADVWSEKYDRMSAGKTAVFYQPLEESLRESINAMLVSFAGGARPQQLIFNTRENVYVRTLPDRSQQADYSKVDRERAYQRRIEQVINGASVETRQVPDFDARIQHLQALISRIVDRGGDVILVRLPSTKRIWDIEEARYPRAIFWNAIAEGVTAHSIHFADFPELSNFDFTDGVHIDVSDQAAFTAALAKVLPLPRPESLTPANR